MGNEQGKSQRHAAVGPPELWEIKRDFQISFLRWAGLRPADDVLDYGCGTLRGGIPIIRYLEPGRYAGIDLREDVLAESKREVAEEGLGDKNPRILHSACPEKERLDLRFDVIWIYSVFFHLHDPQCEDLFAFIAHHLKPGARALANVAIGEAAAQQAQDPARLTAEQAKTCRVFPFYRRELATYQAMARRSGLTAKPQGTVAELGFGVGHEAHDNHLLIEVGRNG